MLLTQINRVKLYQDLLKSYHLVKAQVYSDAIEVFDDIIKSIDEEYNNERKKINSYADRYYTIIMSYRRKLPINRQPLLKKFEYFFHQSFYLIAKERVYTAYSYIQDMKDIATKLKG